MGELFRRFWLPAMLPSELPKPDCPPVRLRLLGEDLVAFRDSNGQIGVVEAHCPHRGASLYFGRNEECGILRERTAGRPLARLRRFAAEQQEVTWSSRAVWSKRGKTQWVEETEPALVLMPVHSAGSGGIRQHHW